MTGSTICSVNLQGLQFAGFEERLDQKPFMVEVAQKWDPIQTLLQKPKSTCNLLRPHPTLPHLQLLTLLPQIRILLK